MIPTHTEAFTRSYAFTAPKMFSCLAVDIRSISTFNTFLNSFMLVTFETVLQLKCARQYYYFIILKYYNFASCYNFYKL